MVNDRRRFVAQSFSCRHQAPAKFGIFISDETATAATHVHTKAAILFEHFFAERHVRAVRRFLFELPRGVAQIELGAQRAACPLRSATLKPGRRRKFCWSKDSTTGPSPLSV